ncbi:MAG TPA: PRC-barrel domain-containing protein [Candidatus Angelobacter sp.]
MPHYGILHGYEFTDIEDLRGVEVYGVNDEKLGTVDDVIFDHSDGEIEYVIVDAGGWPSSKKFVVPANRVETYGRHGEKFYAELDKERIQMLPRFNEETLESERGWEDYEKQYHEGLNKGAILYNKDTGRIVTPPINEVEGARTVPLSEEDRRSLMRDFTPEKMGKEDALLGVASGAGDTTLSPRKASKAGREDVRMQQESMRPAGNGALSQSPRWNDFQRRLRERRQRLVSGCSLCGTQEKVA